MRLTHHTAISHRIQSSHPARPAQFHRGDSRRQRVFAPALHPPQRATPVNEPATVINRVPPAQKPCLLERRPPHPTSVRTVRLLQPVQHPRDDLPAQRQPRLTSRADVDRLNRRRRACKHRARSPSHPARPQPQRCHAPAPTATAADPPQSPIGWSTQKQPPRTTGRTSSPPPTTGSSPQPHTGPAPNPTARKTGTDPTWPTPDTSHALSDATCHQPAAPPPPQHPKQW